MPTKRGWQVSIGSLALLGLGRLLGVRELYELAVLLVTLVVLAVVSVISKKPKVSIERVIENPRVEADGVIRLELRLTNSGKRPSSTLQYVDKLPQQLGGDVRVRISSLKAGGSRVMRLEVRPKQRGRYQVGPGTLSKTDSFGLASWTYRTTPTRKVVVYPSFVELDDIDVPGDLVESQGRSKSHRSSTGNEFYALRRFQDGDDQRKIHWPSTARLGTTMVRQEERSGQLKVNVLVDPSGATGENYERCLSSAASVLRCFLNRGYTMNLAIGASIHQANQEAGAYHLMMERLAISTGESAADTSRMWSALGEGLNVLICRRPNPESVRRLVRDPTLARRTLLIVHSDSRLVPEDPLVRACRQAGSRVIETHDLRDLSASWKRVREVRSNSAWANR